jgi:hypothetical protein
LLAFPVHPKAVALLPIALASAFLLFKELTKRKWVIALILVTLTGFAVESVTFWLERYICTRSPETQEIIAAHSLPWNLIWTAPGLFVQMATKDFLSSVISDFTVSHHIKQTHAWLPQSLTVLPIWMLLVNSLCAAVNFLTNIAIFYFCLVFFLNTVVLRPRKILSGFFATPLSDNLEEGGEPRIITISYLLGSACFASLIGTILLTGSIHTFYLVSLQAPLLFLTALFCMAARAVDLSWASQWRIHCFWLQILAIISIFLIIFRYYPYITTPESRESFTPNRAIMLSPWRYKNQKNAIEEAYADCHLPPTGAARHLVLDDFTYPVLKHSYQPFSFHYITDLFDSNHFSAPKLLEDMKYYNSQGIILNCKSVPPALAPYLTDHGGYCCAAGKDLPK